MEGLKKYSVNSRIKDLKARLLKVDELMENHAQLQTDFEELNGSYLFLVEKDEKQRKEIRRYVKIITNLMKEKEEQKAELDRCNESLKEHISKFEELQLEFQKISQVLEMYKEERKILHLEENCRHNKDHLIKLCHNLFQHRNKTQVSHLWKDFYKKYADDLKYFKLPDLKIEKFKKIKSKKEEPIEESDLNENVVSDDIGQPHSIESGYHESDSVIDSTGSFTSKGDAKFDQELDNRDDFNEESNQEVGWLVDDEGVGEEEKCKNKKSKRAEPIEENDLNENVVSDDIGQLHSIESGYHESDYVIDNSENASPANFAVVTEILPDLKDITIHLGPDFSITGSRESDPCENESNFDCSIDLLKAKEVFNMADEELSNSQVNYTPITPDHLFSPVHTVEKDGEEENNNLDNGVHDNLTAAAESLQATEVANQEGNTNRKSALLPITPTKAIQSEYNYQSKSNGSPQQDENPGEIQERLEETDFSEDYDSDMDVNYLGKKMEETLLNEAKLSPDLDEEMSEIFQLLEFHKVPGLISPIGSPVRPRKKLSSVSKPSEFSPVQKSNVERTEVFKPSVVSPRKESEAEISEEAGKKMETISRNLEGLFSPVKDKRQLDPPLEKESNLENIENIQGRISLESLFDPVNDQNVGKSGKKYESIQSSLRDESENPNSADLDLQLPVRGNVGNLETSEKIQNKSRKILESLFGPIEDENEDPNPNDLDLLPPVSVSDEDVEKSEGCKFRKNEISRKKFENLPSPAKDESEEQSGTESDIQSPNAALKGNVESPNRKSEEENEIESDSPVKKDVKKFNSKKRRKKSKNKKCRKKLKLENDDVAVGRHFPCLNFKKRRGSSKKALLLQLIEAAVDKKISGGKKISRKKKRPENKAKSSWVVEDLQEESNDDVNILENVSVTNSEEVVVTGEGGNFEGKEIPDSQCVNFIDMNRTVPEGNSGKSCLEIVEEQCENFTEVPREENPENLQKIQENFSVCGESPLSTLEEHHENVVQSMEEENVENYTEGDRGEDFSEDGQKIPEGNSEENLDKNSFAEKSAAGIQNSEENPSDDSFNFISAERILPVDDLREKLAEELSKNLEEATENEPVEKNSMDDQSEDFPKRNSEDSDKNCSEKKFLPEFQIPDHRSPDDLPVQHFPEDLNENSSPDSPKEIRSPDPTPEGRDFAEDPEENFSDSDESENLVIDTPKSSVGSPKTDSSTTSSHKYQLRSKGISPHGNLYEKPSPRSDLCPFKRKTIRHLRKNQARKKSVEDLRKTNHGEKRSEAMGQEPVENNSENENFCPADENENFSLPPLQFIPNDYLPYDTFIKIYLNSCDNSSSDNESSDACPSDFSPVRKRVLRGAKKCRKRRRIEEHSEKEDPFSKNLTLLIDERESRETGKLHRKPVDNILNLENSTVPEPNEQALNDSVLEPEMETFPEAFCDLTERLTRSEPKKRIARPKTQFINPPEICASCLGPCTKNCKRKLIVTEENHKRLLRSMTVAKPKPPKPTATLTDDKNDVINLENSPAVGKSPEEAKATGGYFLDSILTKMTEQTKEFKCDVPKRVATLMPIFEPEEENTNFHQSSLVPNLAGDNKGKKPNVPVPNLMNYIGEIADLRGNIQNGGNPGKNLKKDKKCNKIVRKKLEEFVEAEFQTREELREKSKSYFSVMFDIHEEIIAKVIVEMILENIDEEIQLYEPPNPPMTQTQMKLFVFLVLLRQKSENHKNLKTLILNIIWEKLFPENFFWPDDSVQMCSRFYTALCKHDNDLPSIWRFFRKAMTEMSQRFPIVIHTILLVWPDILHDAQLMKSNLQATTAVQLILHNPRSDGFRNGLQERKLIVLKELLMKFYNFAPMDPLFDQYPKYVMGEFLQETEKSEKSMSLIVSFRDWDWTKKQILPKLLEIVNAWAERKVSLNIGLKSLKLLKDVSERIPLNIKDHKVEEIYVCLTNILNSEKMNPKEEEDIVDTLIAFKDHVNIKEVLSNWMQKGSITGSLRKKITQAMIAKKCPKNTKSRNSQGDRHINNKINKKLNISPNVTGRKKERNKNRKKNNRNKKKALQSITVQPVR